MVRILSLATILIAGAFTAQAAQFCQCLFQDGSHCCVTSDPEFGDLDCQQACSGAHRADGTTNPDGIPGTPCNADGKFSTVSVVNAQFRTSCFRQ